MQPKKKRDKSKTKTKKAGHPRSAQGSAPQKIWQQPEIPNTRELRPRKQTVVEFLKPNRTSLTQSPALVGSPVLSQKKAQRESQKMTYIIESFTKKRMSSKDLCILLSHITEEEVD